MTDENKSLLHLWLSVATDGLSDAARERIRAEMEAHLAESVAAQAESGQSETEAIETALLALGEPKAANRAYKRIYLTQAQSVRIEKLLCPPKIAWLHGLWGVISSVYLVMIVMGEPIQDLINFPEPVKYLFLLFSFLFLLDLPMLMGFLLAKYLRLQRALLGMMAFSTIYPTLLYFVVTVACQRPLGYFFIPMTLSALSFFIVSIVWIGPLWLKVRRNPHAA